MTLRNILEKEDEEKNKIGLLFKQRGGQTVAYREHVQSGRTFEEE